MTQTHKRKKYSRAHGRGMGTAGHGSRKQHRSSGNRGGRGLSGTGKRADHKKTLITNIFGNSYFGKKGATSRGSRRDKKDRINLKQIEENLGKYGKKNGAVWEIDLSDYKILGDGEVKNKIVINAKEVSNSAREKIEKIGGKVILPLEKEKEAETPEEKKLIKK